VAALFDHVRDHPLWEHRQTLLWLAFASMFIEMVVLAWRFQQSYRPALMLSTTAMWVVEQGGRLLMYPLRLSLFVVVARLAVFPALPQLLAFAAAYLCVDLLYYWKHRMLHTFDWAWALHSVHHSSEELNLMAALRLGWVQRWLDDFFYLPLVLLGLDPVLVLLTVELNHASQFWCHTRCLGRLRWLDAWLNTPSNHRVHHARVRAIADHNFGSTLMCWDRWFGSYLQEPDAQIQVFGLEEGVLAGSDNPLRIQLAPLARYLRASWPRPSQGQP
jgi:sterol desaturase/sphingolipid hydroxylase (fatty acid hydroxylase superfamily)